MSSSNTPHARADLDREALTLTHEQAIGARGRGWKRIDEIVYGLTDAIQAGRVSERFANLSVKVRG
jgi:hypothetical protein